MKMFFFAYQICLFNQNKLSDRCLCRRIFDILLHRERIERDNGTTPNERHGPCEKLHRNQDKPKERCNRDRSNEVHN